MEDWREIASRWYDGGILGLGLKNSGLSPEARDAGRQERGARGVLIRRLRRI
jgi:hypothetical protein